MTSKYNSKTTGSELVRDFGPNIKGKIILVTGATPASIGALFALAVAKGGPKLIILAGRNEDSTRQTAADITNANPDVSVRTLRLDLGSLQTVREAAAQVNAWDDVPRVDVLVNNAGIMAVPFRRTAEGFESQFGTNHLGHFLFTNLIMPRLLAAAAPRVLAISSNGHRLNPIRWTDYNFGDGKHYDKWRAYGQSKTANNLMALGLAQKLGARGLQAYSVHPGVYFGTGLAEELDWENDLETLKANEIIMGTCFIYNEQASNTAEEIVATHIYAAFSDDLKDHHNGAYLLECHVADQWKEEVWPWGKDPVDAQRLWDLSEKLVGQKFEY